MKYLKEGYGFLGLLSIGYGLFLYDLRIAFVVVGALLLLTAFVASIKG